MTIVYKHRSKCLSVKGFKSAAALGVPCIAKSMPCDAIEIYQKGVGYPANRDSHAVLAGTNEQRR